MSSIGLHIGLQALLTSQSGLDVTGHNVANANTPGYSRQALGLGSSAPLHLRGRLMGMGVDPGSISRTIDSILARRIVTQGSGLARLETNAAGLAQIEALFGEPGTLGLNHRFGSFFESISALSTSVHDGVLRGAMVQEAAGFTAQLRDLAGGLSRFGSDTLEQIPLDLQEINRLTNEVANLNVSIVELEASGSPANDLRDQRQMRMGELAKLADVTYQEQPSGALAVTLGGRMLVGNTQSYAVERRVDSGGKVELHIQGASVPLQVMRGSVAARLELGHSVTPELTGKLDELARNLMLEFNRAHSTGVPQQGYFQQLVGAYAVNDTNGNGNRKDELLKNAGLPFELTNGELSVNMTDVASGEVTTHRIAIDLATTTVGGFLDSLTAISGLSANLDAQGRVRIQAVNGKGFDFSARLDGSPDDIGSFGGAQATLATTQSAPFVLANGDTLDLIGPSGAFSVTLDAADFDNIGQASADELAAALNADPGMQTNGLRASAVDGRLVLQTQGSGPSASFTVSGGSAIGALGIAAGTSVSGRELAVEVATHGTYTGNANERYTFTPTVDGTIGTTPGLAVEVRDSKGVLVTTLEVGEGYQPGDELEVANGIRVSFGFGDVSATNGERFGLDAMADSDSADVLVALGLNAFFVGTGAADIAVRQDILDDPSRLSASKSGAPGDNGALLRMLDLQNGGAAGLGGQSLNAFYSEMVTSLGSDTAATNSALATETFLMDGLLQRRDQVSGVNVDEELVNMIQFEQTYQAAARYIQVVSRIGEELLALI